MANKFWVGGTGTWDATTTTNWSLTSGGAGGAVVPTSADAVIIDANSGTGTCTMTAGLNPTVGSISFIPNNFTLNLNNNNLTCFSYSNAPNPVSTVLVARVIAFGATGQITITGNNGTVCQTRFETGLTLTGSKKFVLTYSGSVGTRTVGCVGFGAASPPNYYITGGTDIVTFVGPSGIVTGDLNFTGFGGRVIANQWFLYGNVTLSPTQTLNTAAVGTMQLVPTSGTYTITTNGASLFNNSINIPYSGSSTATWIFAGSNVTIPSITLSSGTVDFANTNPNVTITGTFSSTGTGTRTIKWGTGNVTLSSANTTLMNFSNQTGMTFVGMPNPIQVTGNGTSGQTRTISIGNGGGGAASKSPSFNFTAGVDNLSLNGGFANLTFPGFTGNILNTTRTFYNNFTLLANVPVLGGTAVTTFAPQSGNITFTTSEIPYPMPVTVNGAGNVVLSGNLIMGNSNANVLSVSVGNLNLGNYYVNAFSFSGNSATGRGIVANSNGFINLTGDSTNVISMTNTTGWNVTGNLTFNLTANANANTRTISVGNLSSANDFNIIVSNASDTINGTFSCNDLVFNSGFTGNLSNDVKTTRGNVILSSGMNCTAGSNALIFAGNGNYIFDTKNIPVLFPITVNAPSSNGTWVDNVITDPTTFTLSAGNVTANGDVAFDTVLINASTGNNNLFMGNGTWTLNGTGTIWSQTANIANANIYPGNSTLVANNDTANRTLAFANGTVLNNVVLQGNTTISNTIITGNLTLNTLSDNIANSWSLILGSNNTFTMNNWTVTGTSGNVVNLYSTTSGTPHNLVLTGGGNINTVDWLTIQDSNASPDNTWYPGANSINNGGVTGWVFPTLSNSSNFFLLF